MHACSLLAAKGFITPPQYMTTNGRVETFSVVGYYTINDSPAYTMGCATLFSTL
jgi:hypothetical protein